MHSFIETMFYGFYKPYTKKKIYEEGYEAFLPWEHDGYGGSLVFEDRGRIIRLERQMTKGKDSLGIFDVATGEDITEAYDYNNVIRQPEPGLRHFGHNKTTYRNTVSMTQMSSRTDEAMITEIKDNMSNLASSHEANISVDKVIEKIDKDMNVIGSMRKRTSPYYKLSKRIKELEEEKTLASSYHREILQENIKQNQLQKEKDHLVVNEIEYKKDLEYLRAKKLEEVIFKAEGLNKDMSEIRLRLKVKELYKAFDINTYQGLKDQIQDKEIQENKRAEIEQRKTALVEELSSLEGTLKMPEDVGDLKNSYNSLSDAIIKFQEGSQKITAGESDVKSIERELDMLGNHEGPGSKWSLYACLGAFLVAGLGGIIISPWLFVLGGICLVGALAAYLVDRQRRRANEAYVSKRNYLTDERDKAQGQLHELRKEVEQLLKGFNATNQLDLVSQREQINQFILQAEGQQRGYESAKEKQTQLKQEVQAIEERIDKIDKSVLDLKAGIDAAMTRFNLRDQDAIEVAFGNHMAYRDDMKALEHMEARYRELMGGRDLEALKGQCDMPARQVTMDEEALVASLDDLAKKKLSLAEAISEAAARQAALSEQTRSVAEIHEQIQEQIRMKEQYDHDLAVGKLMKDTIETIAIDIQNNFAPLLNDEMSQVVTRVSQGKYTNIKVNPDMVLTVYDEKHHRTIPVERLSAGTIDQMYFGLRLGISEVLTEGKKLPLILDDTFVQYDNQRLAQVMDLLEGQERQVLLFTCHTREQEVLEDKERAYTLIEL